MESLSEITSGITDVLEGMGLDFQTDGTFQKGKERIICFNDPNGNRICEEVPLFDEIKCDDHDLCSVYLTNIKENTKVEDIAKTLGIRSFVQKKEGMVTKVLTGIVHKSDIHKLGDHLNCDLEPVQVPSLRKVKKGDIYPPSVCKLNPLSSKCEHYIYSDEWHWLGPFKGWIKADSFTDAIEKITKGKKDTDGKVENQSEPSGEKTSKSAILTTI